MTGRLTHASSVSTAPRRPATVRDFLAIPEERRFHELIDAEIVEKTVPSFEHGDAQSAVAGNLKSPFQMGRSGGPGGWWIVTEVEILLGEEIFRPDVAGWRRERLPTRPERFPVEVRPDWVCEVVSPAKPSADRVGKVRAYQAGAISHYWLLDLRDGTLTVLRHSRDGYIVILTAQRDETVHAEPFGALGIKVADLFGDVG